MVKKGNTLMKITFDDRQFIIQALSIKNPHLIFEEGAEKNEIVFSPSSRLNSIAEAVGVGFAPIIMPEKLEWDAEFDILYWEKDDENFKTFKMRFVVKN